MTFHDRKDVSNKNSELIRKIAHVFKGAIFDIKEVKETEVEPIINSKYYLHDYFRLVFSLKPGPSFYILIVVL